MVLAGVAASGRQVRWPGFLVLAALALAATIPDEEKTAQQIEATAAEAGAKAHLDQYGTAGMAARAS